MNTGNGRHLDGLAKVTSETWVAFGSPGRILKTRDAGASWQEQVISPDSIRFFGGAFRGNQGVLAGNSATLIRTEDGGKTWLRVASPTQEHLFAFAFKDEKHGIAVGSAGATWEYIPLPTWKRLWTSPGANDLGQGSKNGNHGIHLRRQTNRILIPWANGSRKPFLAIAFYQTRPLPDSNHG